MFFIQKQINLRVREILELAYISIRLNLHLLILIV